MHKQAVAIVTDERFSSSPPLSANTEIAAIRQADPDCSRGFQTLQTLSSNIAETDKTAIYIDLGLETEATDRRIGHGYLHDYARRHPDQRTEYVRIQSHADLQTWITRIQISGLWIAHLMIASHGSNLHQQAITAYSNRGFSIGQPFPVIEFTRNFQNLRFTPDITIIFRACDLLAHRALGNINEIAQSFGLQSGRIYANETLGSHFRELLHFGDSSQRAYAAARFIGSEINEVFSYNRGYTWIRLSSPTNRECTFPSMLRDIMERH